MAYSGLFHRPIPHIERRTLEYHPPVLPHQREILFDQLLELIIYRPKLRSHHQSHLLAQAETIQHIIDRVPLTHLTLARGVERERYASDTDNQFCELV